MERDSGKTRINGSFVLSYLYRCDDPSNPYRGRSALLRWVERDLERWCAQSQRSARSVLETGLVMRMVGTALPRSCADRVRSGLNQAVPDLVSGEPSGLGAAALDQVAQLTGGAGARQGCRRTRDRWLDRQRDEGWFPPTHGGIDLATQTRSLFHLARIQRDGGERVTKAIRRLLGFLQWFVNPHGLFFESGQRGVSPAGFELLAPIEPVAAAIASRLREAQRSGIFVDLRAANGSELVELMGHYALAHDFASDLGACDRLPTDRDDAAKVFVDAGVHVHVDQANHAVVWGRRGGAVQVCGKRGQGDLMSLGYENKEGGASWRDPTPLVRHLDGEIVIRSTFTREAAPTSRSQAPLRLPARLEPWTRPARGVLALARRSNRERSPTLERRVRFGEEIQIADVVRFSGGSSVRVRAGGLRQPPVSFGQWRERLRDTGPVSWWSESTRSRSSGVGIGSSG